MWHIHSTGQTGKSDYSGETEHLEIKISTGKWRIWQFMQSGEILGSLSWQETQCGRGRSDEGGKGRKG